MIFTVFAGMHVHRLGSVPGTLLVHLPGQCGNPTLWAANMPVRAAERAVHDVEIPGEGPGRAARNGRSHLGFEASHASMGEIADKMSARVLEFVRRVAARRSV